VIANPVPLTVAPLIVKGAVPVEVKVSDFVVAVLSVTLPKTRLVVLTLSVGTEAFNCSAKLFVTPVELAVNVAACAVPTALTFAVKPALVAFAGTISVDGTVTAALLLVIATLKPPLGAAPLKVTVHASVPAPVIEALPHEKALNVGAFAIPVPLKFTLVVLLFVPFVVRVRSPFIDPA
jgi:hypothetical protein